MIFGGAIGGNIPGLEELAEAAEVVGDATTLSGVAIKNWDAVVTNTPVAAGELQTEINESIANLQAAGNSLTPEFVTISGGAGTAWGAAETSLFNGLTDIYTAIGAVGSAYNTATSAASTALTGVETSLNSLFGDTGSTAQNVTDTVTNNAFTITSGSAPNTTGDATFGASGSSIGLATTGNSGNLNQNETDSVNSTSVADATQSDNPGGTVQYTQTTTTQSTGQVSASISGENDVTDLSDASISLAAGAQASLDGANNAIALAASAALTIGSGGTGDTVNINSTGDTVNASGAGAPVGGDTATIVGTTEDVSLGTAVTIDITTGKEVTITGTDGILTANNDATGGVIQNTVNWTAGGSQDQVLSGLGSGLSEEIENYSGTNLGGTLNNETFDYTAGTSFEATFTGLGSGITEELENFAGLNDTGTLNNETFDLTGGTSYEALFTGLPSGTSEEIANYSGLNDTGTLVNETSDLTGGTSFESIFSGLPSGQSEEIENYTGLNDTGTLANETVDFTGGTSFEEIFSGLPGGTTEELKNFTGLNDTGTLENETSDFTSGASAEQIFTGLPTGISEETDNFTGLNDTGSLTTEIGDFTSGTSFEKILTGLPSGTSEEIKNFSGTNDTGTLENETKDYSAGNSQLELFAPASSISTEFENFSGLNDSGTRQSAILDNANGTNVDIVYNYSSGIETSTTDGFYNGATLLGVGDFTPSGSFSSGYNPGSAFSEDDGFAGFGNGDSGGYDGGYGGYGGGYELTKGTPAKGSNIGVIAQYDASQANTPYAAEAAEAAQLETYLVSQLQASGSTAADAPLFEGAKWNSKIVTWSLAANPGTAGSPFSSYISSQYASLVQQAFQAWGAAAGLTFEQVSDSNQSDIRIGWASLATATSGAGGYTSYQYQNGQLQPNVIIQLEDPSQDSLVAGAGSNTASSSTGSTLTTANSTLAYSGTDINLYQLILHEIGHALGLADNADPNSVMYYQASNNTTLDSNDIEGIQALYDGKVLPSLASQSDLPAALTSPVSINNNSTLLQMIQAIASFPAGQAAIPSFVPPDIPPASVISAIAASQHA